MKIGQNYTAEDNNHRVLRGDDGIMTNAWHYGVMAETAQRLDDEGG